MNLFIEVVLPVFFIFFAGYVIQKWKKLDIKSVSTVAIYLLSPCLVFRTFYQANLNREYGNMVIFSLLFLFAFILLTKLYSKIMHYTGSMESGLMLSTAFMNSGNYGAPIVLFAFGEKGFAYAVTFMVLQSVIMNVFGVYYALRGQSGVKIAIKKVFEMPATYAVILALLVQFSHITVPKNVMMPIDLLADAAIPVAMLILGMQLAEIELVKMDVKNVAFATISRLMLSPFIAYLILTMLGVNGLLKSVLIVLSSMPTAVTTTMYAVQFDAKPRLVSSIAFVTTLTSIVTITGLLVILK
jgi:hypothetical protein